MDVVASAITIVSSALTLSVTVTNIVHDVKHRNENLQELETKLKILREVIREVQRTFNIREERRATLHTDPDENEIRTLTTVKWIVGCCNDDLEKYEKRLSKLLDSKDRQNFVLQAGREQVARPILKKIMESIDGHYNSLHLLMSVHQGHVSDARFDAILKGINEINLKLDAQPPLPPPARTDSEGSLEGDTSQSIEREDHIGSLYESESVAGDGDSPSKPPQSPQQSSEKGKPLLQAVKDGLTDVLDTLLSDSDTNLEETDDRGRTPLILAADLGKADMVNRFVESQSIEINATDELGRTALHYCTQTKMMNQTTEKLLDHGADVNVQDDGSYPPMYYAIKDDNYDAVKMLLDHHATTDFEFPEKPIPRSINGLIEKYNTTGSTDSVSEFQRARTNDSDDLKRK